MLVKPSVVSIIRALIISSFDNITVCLLNNLVRDTMLRNLLEQCGLPISGTARDNTASVFGTN